MYYYKWNFPSKSMKVFEACKIERFTNKLFTIFHTKCSKSSLKLWKFINIKNEGKKKQWCVAYCHRWSVEWPFLVRPNWLGITSTHETKYSTNQTFTRVKTGERGGQWILQPRLITRSSVKYSNRSVLIAPAMWDGVS